MTQRDKDLLRWLGVMLVIAVTVGVVAPLFLPWPQGCVVFGNLGIHC